MTRLRSEEILLALESVPSGLIPVLLLPATGVPLSPALTQVAEKLNHNDKVLVIDCASPADAEKLVRTLEYCVLVCQASQPEHVAPLVQIMAGLSEKIRRHKFATVAVSSIRDPAQEKKLTFAGISDILREPVNEKSLLFKIDLNIKSLDVPDLALHKIAASRFGGEGEGKWVQIEQEGRTRDLFVFMAGEAWDQGFLPRAGFGYRQLAVYWVYVGEVAPELSPANEWVFRDRKPQEFPSFEALSPLVQQHLARVFGDHSGWGGEASVPKRKVSTVRPSALAFAVSELMVRKDLKREEIVRRSCEEISLFLRGAHVELWFKASQEGTWRFLASSAPDSSPRFNPTQTDGEVKGEVTWLPVTAAVGSGQGMVGLSGEGIAGATSQEMQLVARVLKGLV